LEINFGFICYPRKIWCYLFIYNVKNTPLQNNVPIKPGDGTLYNDIALHSSGGHIENSVWVFSKKIKNHRNMGK
jgi:hypothetical protein